VSDAPQTSLPDDVEELKRIIAEKDQRIAALREENRLMRARIFGASSEKRAPEDDAQARLFNEAEAYARPESTPESVKTRVASFLREKVGRKPLGKDLPRKDIVCDLSDAEKVCDCGALREAIGEEVSERLHIIPQRAVVHRIVRRSYVCRQCETSGDEQRPAVITAPAPARLLPKSIATAGLLAYVFTAKFCDALPFFRQEKMFARIGVTLNRATMCNWAKHVAQRLVRLRKLLWDEIRSGKCIGIDETPVQVLKEPGRKPTDKSFMFVARGGDPERPAIVYEYRRTRGASFLRRRLRRFVGAIISDDFSGYSVFDALRSIIRAACWAHVRRKFVDAEKAAGATESTQWVLERIRKLYRIEEEIKDLTPEKRKKHRQRAAQPITQEIFERLDRLRETIPPTGALGKAVAYALKNQARLLTYLEDGGIPIDNNWVENAIRPFVVGRKNWLFNDQPTGAAASAFLYSLIETAKANGHEPYRYLYFLFEKFPAAGKSRDDLRALLPMYASPEDVDRFFAANADK
jgi:transposase